MHIIHGKIRYLLTQFYLEKKQACFLPPVLLTPTPPASSVLCQLSLIAIFGNFPSLLALSPTQEYFIFSIFKQPLLILQPSFNYYPISFFPVYR